MNALLLVTALLAEAPKPECLPVTGGRVCGFHCETANGLSAKCAETPFGVCTQAAGAVLCFDPPPWLAVAYGGSPPPPKCLIDGTSVACGYDCKSGGGKVACARTPAGACLMTPKHDVVCADPPAAVYGVFGAKTPRMACASYLQTVACGYGCVQAGGVLACATTPFGVCDTREATPVCFDPDKYVICAGGAQTPRPTCTQHAGKLACGYRCATVGSEIACAQTPKGTCDDQGPGGPVCFDPPVRGGSATCTRIIGSE